MGSIITDLSQAITPEDIAYTTILFKEVWDKQGMKVEMGYVIPKDMAVLDAVEKRVAKKLTQFIDEIKMFSGENWKIEMKNFRDAALEQYKAEERKELLADEFESRMNKIDWKNNKLEDSAGNFHTMVAISDIQVVTKVLDSFYVWHKSTGESMMLGCDGLRIVSIVE